MNRNAAMVDAVQDLEAIDEDSSHWWDGDLGQYDGGEPTVKSNTIAITYCTDRIHLHGHLSLLQVPTIW